MAVTTYADIGDLACTVLDADVAGKLIERASLMVTMACRHAESMDPDAARAVVCDMVETALASPTADEFGTTPQTLQSISSYSNTWTWGNPVGKLRLEKRHYDLLGVGAHVTYAEPWCPTEG